MQNTAFKLIQIINNKLAINEEGLIKLKQIKGYIFPICVVGPILTGKSSLLNQIIGKEVFKVGETTIPTSKGICAYMRQIKVEVQKNSIWQLIMDIQGFDNSFNENNQEIDIQLFLLVVNLCKIVMYNSFGALDSKILERIAYLSHFLPGSLKSEPQIIFVQRDFALQLASFDNQPLKTDEYLEYFMRNYKDKITITKLTELFKKNNPTNNHEKTNKIHTLSCALIAHPEQTDKHKKSINRLTKHIFNKLLQSLVKKQQTNNQNQTMNVVQFVYMMTKCIQLLSSSKTTQNLKQLQSLSEKSREEEKKQWLSLYKLAVSQKCKKQLKPNFPMPQQLLLFKFKKINQQSLQKLQSYKNQQLFIVSVIGHQKLDEYNYKTIDKLKQENAIKINQFIQSKVSEIISSKKQQQFSKTQEQQTLINLLSYYPFINENYYNFIKYNIYQQLYHIAERKYSSKIQQNIQKMRENQQNKLKFIQFEKQIQQKNSAIEKLQNQLKIYKQRIEKYHQHFQEQQKQTCKFHNFMGISLSSSQTILKQIRNHLKHNINEQTPTGLKTQQKLQIINSINQIKLLITDEHRKQQKNQIQRMVFLEQTNKKLREHIEQLFVSNTCVTIMESKYNEILRKLEDKEKEIKSITIEKNTSIQQLNSTICHQKQLNKWLQSDIQMIKAAANDKSKQQFFQKIMKSKQTSLEQIRTQLLETINKYTQDINEMRKIHNDKQTEMTKNISMLVLKNQQLSNKNQQLSRTMVSLQQKHKKQTEDKLQQKQKTITNQQQKIRQLQDNIQLNISEYMNISKNIEQVITEKDQHLLSFSKEIQTLKLTIESMSQRLDSSQEQSVQYRQKYNQMQIEKVDLQSKIKREEILTNNKIKHIEQNNEKLKSEIKQKQNTFDMMLLQLRTNSMLNNSLNLSNFMADEKKYIKKIDYLQQIAMRELDDISNQNKSKQEKWGSRDDKMEGRLSLTSCKPSTYCTRSQCQDIVESGLNATDIFRLKYDTDKKPKTNLKLSGFSFQKNPIINNIKASMRSSHGFRTARKKL